MPGYKLSRQDMDLLVTFLCCECLLVLRDPVQTMMCGHRFCRSCLETLISSTGTSFCPVDKVALKAEEVFPDKFAAREILSTIVCCVFVEDGCLWRGEIKEIEEHLNGACLFVRVNCINPGCMDKLTRSSLAQHLSGSCPHRIIACTDCHKEIQFYMMESHLLGECPMSLVECSQCHEMIRRNKLAEHVDPDLGTCSEVEGPCAFARLGCTLTTEVRKSEREQHHKSATVFHLKLMHRHLLKVEHQISCLANEMSLDRSQNSVAQKFSELHGSFNLLSREFQKTVASLTSQINDLQAQLNSSAAVGSRVDQVELTISSLMDQLTDFMSKRANPKNELRVAMSDECHGEDQNMKRQLTLAIDMIRRLENRINSQDHMLTLKNIGMADLEERFNDMTVSGYNGLLIWRIHDFAKRRHDAVTGRQTSFYSAPFYSSKYGYKLCARIYLNGDGIGKGTHLSLFIVIMRGLYDPILPWPFKQRVTMTLIDQDHRQNKSDYFNPDPSSSSFKKPIAEMNIASGCPMFCSLSELDSRSYVRDDTMFIKLRVDNSNLDDFE